MKTWLVTLAIQGLCIASLAQERTALLPVLQPGDVLLCDGFPKRTVTRTMATTYQLARIGYASVQDFQRDEGLKADGIIGPITKKRIEELYSQQFGPLACMPTNAPLVFSSLAVTGAADAQVSLAFAVSNRAMTAIRVVGELITGNDDKLLFVKPRLSIGVSFCQYRENGVVAMCMGKGCSVTLCSTGTVIRAGSALEFSARIPGLASNEHGSVGVHLDYLDWNGAAHHSESQHPMPH